MKISKEGRQLARQLFRLSFTNGRLDRSKITSLIQSIIAEKPRHYIDGLYAYERLLRLELDKRHALIESAIQLNDSTANTIVSNLRNKYGNDLTTEFTVNPALIGGMRVKIGSDVWDGSVKNRLTQLQEQL